MYSHLNVKNLFTLLVVTLSLITLCRGDYCRDQAINSINCSPNGIRALKDFEFPCTDIQIEQNRIECYKSFSKWERYTHACPTQKFQHWIECEEKKLTKSKNIRSLSQSTFPEFGIDINTEELGKCFQNQVDFNRLLLAGSAMAMDSNCGIFSTQGEPGEGEINYGQLKLCYQSIFKYFFTANECEELDKMLNQFEQIPGTYTEAQKQMTVLAQNLAETCYVFLTRGQFDSTNMESTMTIYSLLLISDLRKYVSQNQSQSIQTYFNDLSTSPSFQFNSIQNDALRKYGKCVSNYLGDYQVLTPIVRTSPLLKNHFTKDECLESSDLQEKQALQALVDQDADCRYAKLDTPELLSDSQKLNTGMQNCYKKLTETATTTKCKEFIAKETTDTSTDIGGGGGTPSSSSILSSFGSLITIFMIVLSLW